MPSSIITSLDSAMSQTSDETPRHLLLANGFTIAAGVPDFNDQALFGQTRQYLLRKAQRPDLAERIGQFQSSNIEFILGQLQGSGVQEGSLQPIREGFIWSVERLHPAGWSSLNGANMCTATQFLNGFHSVFTTNYDRLMYWAVNHPKDCSDCGSNWHFGDGFRRYSIGPPKCDSLCFREDFSSSFKRVYQLHGALHYFEENGHVHKRQAGRYDDLSWQEKQEFSRLAQSVGFDKDDTLSYRLLVSLQAGRFPVFVAEGDAKSKLDRIKSNRYLRSSFAALSHISGHLFIYGSAVREEDMHLWIAIAGNRRIRSVNVSIFEGDTGAMERAKNFLRPNASRKLRFFDAETARIWRP